MSIESRIKRLETSNPEQWCIYVFKEPGESNAEGLARTLKERGLTDDQVGHVTYWPGAGDGGCIESEDRTGGKGFKKLRGAVNIDDVITEMVTEA